MIHCRRLYRFYTEKKCGAKTVPPSWVEPFFSLKTHFMSLVLSGKVHLTKWLQGWSRFPWSRFGSTFFLSVFAACTLIFVYVSNPIKNQKTMISTPYSQIRSEVCSNLVPRVTQCTNLKEWVRSDMNKG